MDVKKPKGYFISEKKMLSFIRTYLGNQSLHKIQGLHIRPSMPHQPIGNILHIVCRGTKRIIQLIQIHRPRIIHSQCHIIVPILLKCLLEPWSRSRSFRTVSHHLENTARWITRVKGHAVESLHDSRVVDSVVGIAYPDIAAGFLHDYTQDDPRVDPRFLRYGGDG